MNCFNSQEYLNESIDSVLSQSYENWEMILWDNQSTDNSADIVNQYTDDRINYFYSNEHVPLGEARNMAVNKARGTWLAFLDCDDLWLPDKLEKQIAIALEEDGDLGLIYGHMNIFSNSQKRQSMWSKSMLKNSKNSASKILPEGQVFNKLLNFNFIPLLSAMVRRSAYNDVGGINPMLKQAEDYDLFLKIAEKFKVRAIQSVICRYRVHESNVSHSNIFLNFEECLSIISKYLPKKEAQNAIGFQNTYYAIAEIKHGIWFQGVIRLISKGDLILFVRKTLSKISNLFNDPDF